MRTITYIALFVLLAVQSMAFNYNQDYTELLNLRGNWKFMIGDNAGWAKENLDDSSWESIFVPSSWENQGYQGYDGYAWYRHSFTLPAQNNYTNLYLFLGYIDDVDEVYVNGVKIGGKGSFPPTYWTAYEAKRKYPIPAHVLHQNKPNVIAIRVYDAQIDGGIIRGNIGVYAEKNPIPCDLNLQGYWKFAFGDNMEYAKADYNDTDWQTIAVPGLWEDQLNNRYDGFAWYRTQFKADKFDADKYYVLMLGKIDDLDEVYLNGKLVGHTGKIYDEFYKNRVSGEYTYERFYYLNPGIIKAGQINTIAVRVCDMEGGGGIYTGPIGLVEMKKFVNYWKANQR